MYKINRVYRLRLIGKKNYLIGTGDAYELNEVGTLIWNNLKEKKDILEIIQMISENYQVDIDIAQNDCNDFITMLEEHNILIKE